MAKQATKDIWAESEQLLGILDFAKEVLRTELEGIDRLIHRLDQQFVDVVEEIDKRVKKSGKVVVTGVGKSGHIAHKIAATFASTGTPAIYLHPTEAVHGDLGMVDTKDIVLAISNSGSTVEILALLGPLRRIGAGLIAMTGNSESPLAKAALDGGFHLDASVEKEACPLGLAPTASTTVALALGDALALCMLRKQGFTREKFFVFHPGGNIGKKLAKKVRDLMTGGDKLPKVTEGVSVSDAIAEIQRAGFGVTAVVDGEGVMTGAFSMGDFTRLNLKDRGGAFMQRPVSEFMTRNPKSISPDALAAQALNVMETHHIRALFAVDGKLRPVGIIGIYEVLQAIDY